jgi:hypothetical protein
MNKWLKIGTIIGGVVAAVALVGAVAFAFTPATVRAQAAQQLMGRNFPAFQGQFGGRGQFGGPGGFGARIDYDALLAEALGITVEELEAAKEKAHLAGIQQMVDEGFLTQAQADLMSARVKLNSFIDREALTAKALGITVEELQAARDEGKSMFQLMQDLGLDPATVHTAMNTAYQEAVQQAVTEGVITQDQADIILSLPGGAGFGGPGGRHGRGGPGQSGPGFGGQFGGQFGGPGQAGPGFGGQFGGPGGQFGGPGQSAPGFGGQFGGQFGGPGQFGPGFGGPGGQFSGPGQFDPGFGGPGEFGGSF